MRARARFNKRMGDPEFGVLLFKRPMRVTSGFGGVNHLHPGSHWTLNVRFGFGAIFLWVEPRSVTRWIKSVEADAASRTPCGRCGGLGFVCPEGSTKTTPPKKCTACDGSGEAASSDA